MMSLMSSLNFHGPGDDVLTFHGRPKRNMTALVRVDDRLIEKRIVHVIPRGEGWLKVAFSDGTTRMGIELDEYERARAIRALDARDCRNTNAHDGGDFNYGAGR